MERTLGVIPQGDADPSLVEILVETRGVVGFGPEGEDAACQVGAGIAEDLVLPERETLAQRFP